MSFKKAHITVFILTAILAVVTVSLLAWYFINGVEYRTSPVTVRVVTEHERHVVMDSDGLQPAVLTIRVGDRVTWYNQGLDAVRIISMPRQARYLPEVDTGVIEPDETFTLSFPLPGDWRYYDSRHTGRQGRIIVE